MSVLCLESGGTKLVAATADGAGRLGPLLKRYRHEGQQARETIDQLVDMGSELLQATSEGIESVSFGFGGTVKRSPGRPWACFHESGWNAVDARERLEKAFGVPVLIENDCNLAALGEAHFGAGKDCPGTLLYLTLGTGIGGGIVQGGRLLELGELGEAEIGHLVVEPDGPPCPCGNRGCLETLCSGPGLSSLSERLLGRPIDSRSLVCGFHKGDPDCCRVLEQAAKYLGTALGAAMNILQPQLVVLGGGVMLDNTAFLELIERRTRDCVFPLFRGHSQFCLSSLGETVVCQGAAVYALQHRLGQPGH